MFYSRRHHFCCAFRSNVSQSSGKHIYSCNLKTLSGAYSPYCSCAGETHTRTPQLRYALPVTYLCQRSVTHSGSRSVSSTHRLTHTNPHTPMCTADRCAYSSKQTHTCSRRRSWHHKQARAALLTGEQEVRVCGFIC